MSNPNFANRKSPTQDQKTINVLNLNQITCDIDHIQDSSIGLL